MWQWCSHQDFRDWISTVTLNLGHLLAPFPHTPHPENIWHCLKTLLIVTAGERYHLVGRGNGCSWTLYCVQDRPQQQIGIWSKSQPCQCWGERMVTEILVIMVFALLQTKNTKSTNTKNLSPEYHWEEWGREMQKAFQKTPKSLTETDFQMREFCSQFQLRQ